MTLEIGENLSSTLEIIAISSPIWGLVIVGILEQIKDIKKYNSKGKYND